MSIWIRPISEGGSILAAMLNLPRSRTRTSKSLSPKDQRIERNLLIAELDRQPYSDRHYPSPASFGTKDRYAEYRD